MLNLRLKPVYSLVNSPTRKIQSFQSRGDQCMVIGNTARKYTAGL
jgi:hypothetical protein